MGGPGSGRHPKGWVGEPKPPKLPRPPKPFEMAVTALHEPTIDGWCEFRLSCGHSGRLLLGWTDGVTKYRDSFKTMVCRWCKEKASMK